MWRKDRTQWLDSPVTGEKTLEGAVLFSFAMESSALHAVRLYRMDLPDHACPWGLRAVRLLQ